MKIYFQISFGMECHFDERQQCHFDERQQCHFDERQRGEILTPVEKSP